MRKSPRRAVPKALPRQELRRSLLRIAALACAIGFVWWVGWHSKWAGADATVVVEALDAPRAEPIAVTQDTPQPSEDQQGVTASNAEHTAAPQETPAEKTPPVLEHARTRRDNRTRQETREARPESGGAADTPLD